MIQRRELFLRLDATDKAWCGAVRSLAVRSSEADMEGCGSARFGGIRFGR